MEYLTAVPAYGCDYKTAKAVRQAWAEGKDFQIADMHSRWDGSYVSRSDIAPTVTVTIRFNGLRSTVMVIGGKGISDAS